MNAQGLAWAWLNASAARPFALLESPGPDTKKRLALLAGEPLFVFEGVAAKTWVTVEGRRYRSRRKPEDAFALLGRALATRPSWPPWWPLVHALGYEAGGRFERLPRPKAGPLRLPDWWAFLPGAWCAWDPRAGRWKARSGDLGPALARKVADALGIPAAALRKPPRADERLRFVKGLLALKPEASAPTLRGIAPKDVRSDKGPARYQKMVRRAQAHIRAGDTYQANLSHQLSAPLSDHPFAAYRSLTVSNPAPMAAYIDLGPQQVLCASPERLFKFRDGQVETWPIAGTAPRRARTAAGLRRERAALKASAKDAAEHVMLVDLERNDLGRVCVGGSVKVPKFRTVQTHPSVHHLVSQVTGTLKPGVGLPELYAAAFPGGSITGAPKIRSMQIISALEGRQRGWYTGSLGWWEPRRRQADVNILIRTVYVQGGRAYWPVGAGIVADSVPVKEWRETLAKAKGLEAALLRRT